MSFLCLPGAYSATGHTITQDELARGSEHTVPSQPVSCQVSRVPKCTVIDYPLAGHVAEMPRPALPMATIRDGASGKERRT